MTTAASVTLWDLSPAPGVCPYAQRAWIALEELNVPYTKKFLDKSNKSEEYLTLFRGITQDPAGKGTVPTIIDGDYKLTESMMVVEYLEKKYGKPGKSLLPEDAREYGMVKLFVETWTTHMTGNLFKIVRANNKASLAEAVTSAEAGAKVVNDFIKHNGSSQGGSFFLGARYSFAEAMTAPFLQREVLLMPHVKKWDLVQYAKTAGLDRLVAWIEATLSRPSLSKATASDDLILKGVSQYNQPLKD